MQLANSNRPIYLFNVLSVISEQQQQQQQQQQQLTRSSAFRIRQVSSSSSFSRGGRLHIVPRTRTRSFADARPRQRNSLPTSLCRIVTM